MGRRVGQAARVARAGHVAMDAHQLQLLLGMLLMPFSCILGVKSLQSKKGKDGGSLTRCPRASLNGGVRRISVSTEAVPPTRLWVWVCTWCVPFYSLKKRKTNNETTLI